MSSLQITDDNKKEEEETEVTEVIECPICYEEINPLKNCVTTECGHQFHCKCLMQNSATNGFSCPMCRSIMAEELEDSDSEGEYEDEEDEEDEAGEIDDNALTSFRMFHQQLAGDEVEEEPLEELELEEAADAEIEPRPCSTFIAEKLAAQGVTLEDLVKCLLIEHEEYEPELEVNDRYSDQMFGKFRQIISNYPRQQAAAVAAAQQAVQMPGRTEGQRHQSSRLRAEVEINIGCLQNRYRILEDDDDDDDDV